MRVRQSQPVVVRELVTQVMAHLTEHGGPGALVDFTTWKALVGARLARYAQPTSLRRGQLMIWASDSAALYELSLRAPELLAGLKRALPQREIREFRFHLGDVTW